MLQPVVIWLLGLMTFLAPPDRLAAAPQYPGWEETVEQKQERYLSIAEDIAEVAFDPAEQPVFNGPRGRVGTAALILALAFGESGFARDVDQGPCYRGADGRSSRCDGGQSACMMQIRIGAGRTREGWSQADLFADRTKCLRAGMHLARRSFRACRGEQLEYRLNAYASGVCGRGHLGSQARMRLWRRIYDRAGRPTEPDLTFLPPPEAGSGSELALGK